MSEPAHYTRTASEFLGRRPLPTVIRDRSLVFLFGPGGVGKTTVAARLAQARATPGTVVEPLVVDGPALRAHLVGRARNGRFAAPLEHAPSLIVDGVDCLYGREGAVGFFGGLLGTRCAAGHRTVVVQGCADDSLALLYSSVPPECRASVLLRFPVGRGRRRFVQAECRERGVPFTAARGLVTAEPWTYAGIRASIAMLVAGEG